MSQQAGFVVWTDLLWVGSENIYLGKSTQAGNLTERREISRLPQPARKVWRYTSWGFSKKLYVMEVRSIHSHHTYHARRDAWPSSLLIESEYEECVAI